MQLTIYTALKSNDNYHYNQLDKKIKRTELLRLLTNKCYSTNQITARIYDQQ